MKTILPTLLFLILTSITTTNLNGQTSSYNFNSSSSTFTAITGGTVLGTIANDEQVFNNNTTGETAPQTDIGFPIGFNFYYNGAYYSSFAVSTNGWIMLGNGTFTIGKASNPISISTVSGFANIISAFGRDLEGQTGSQLSYLLTGSEPNRVLVVQWLGYDKFNSTSGESYTFQIRLNESNSSIDFVYGTITTANTSTSTSNNPIQLGIRGATNTDYKNRTTTSSWSSSSSGSTNTGTMRLTTSVKPSSGLKYSWSASSMSYSSANTFIADTSVVKKNSVNNAILRIQVVTTGLTNALSATGFSFKTNGTTSNADIKNAKLWYTGTSGVFDTIGQFGTVVTAPNGTFTVTDAQLLKSGTNYFWLTYDIPPTATSGNFIDGECSSVTVGTSKTPTTQAPAGSRKIANPPLSGIYGIGLALFKMISGKELYFKKETKTVQQEVYAFRSSGTKGRNSENSSSFIEEADRSLTFGLKDTFILMEGDVPYKGNLSFDITPEMRLRFGSSILRSDINAVYANISNAIYDLNNRGIEGPTTFLLQDASYNSETFPITFQDITGSSSVNTITIKPDAGINPQIVMSAGTSIFKLINISNITIDGSNSENGTTRNLSLVSNNTGVSSCIWIGSSGTKPSSNITIKYCDLQAGENTLGSTPLMVSDGTVSGNPGYFSEITIKGNKLQKGRQGIYLNGGTIPQNGSNINISENIINSTGANSIGYLGIYLQGISNSVISGNEIGNLNSTAAQVDKGIWLASGTHSVTVEKNEIYNIGYSGSSGYAGNGIFISSNHLNADILVKNNVIYNIYGDGWNYTSVTDYLDNPAAITLYSSTPQSGIDLYNNSINMFGNTLTHKQALSSGIFLSTGSTASIRNNSIRNSLGNLSDSAYGSCCIFAQNSATQFADIDYNNYYLDPTGNGVSSYGIISAGTSLTLAAWRNSTGKDRSSLSYSPGYSSDTVLIPNINSANCWSLNGRGTQISVVGNDFYGNPRSTAVSSGSTDIGAFEFTPAVQPPAVTGIGSYTNGGNVSFVFGGDTVSSLTLHGVNLPTAITARFYSGVNPPLPIEANYGNCYWLFEPTGGSGYTFDMVLNWDPAMLGTIQAENVISMASYVSGSWVHYDSELNAALRQVSHPGLNSLSVFAIDDMDSPMPVSMAYFNYTLNVRNVLLKWATVSELNNKGFEIERRSEFDRDWKKIHFVEGKGTTQNMVEYSYCDYNLSTAMYNYRIKQIDYNGKYEYFELNADVVVGKPVSYGISQNYPNPSNPSSVIEFQVPNSSNVKIVVYDIEGKEIKTIADGYYEAGYHSAKFDGSNLASGVYFYRIQSVGYSKTLKLILIK